MSQLLHMLLKKNIFEEWLGHIYTMWFHETTFTARGTPLFTANRASHLTISLPTQTWTLQFFNNKYTYFYKIINVH